MEPQAYFTRCCYCLFDNLERLAEETHPITGKFVCSDWRDLHGPGMPHSVIVLKAGQEPAAGQEPVATQEPGRFLGQLTLIDPVRGGPWVGLEAWTDASACHQKDGDPPREAGVGIAFVRRGSEVRRISRRVPNCDTYRGELMAIGLAIKEAAMEPLYVVSDNESAVGVMRRVFTPKANQDVTQKILAMIQARSAAGVETHFAHVNGHSGVLWNELADFLAWESVKDFRKYKRRDPTTPPATRPKKHPSKPRGSTGQGGHAPAVDPQKASFVEDDAEDTRETPHLIAPHLRKQLSLGF